MQIGMDCYKAVKATGAERLFVTHGFQSVFSRYWNEENIAVAAEVKTEYGNEDEEVAPPNLPEGEEIRITYFKL